MDQHKIIQSFYKTYKKLHEEIENKIGNSVNQSYYTSMILNRVMLLFFLEKNNILPEKYLEESIQKIIKEEQHFHDYLLQLFQLINTDYSFREVKNDQIPYLNFSILQFSEDENTRIENELYELIIKRFSKYNWSLEDNYAKSTITPKILGNVFEKYINQKDLGAYYTEDDTTTYITSNSVVAAIINKLINKDSFIETMFQHVKEFPEHFIKLNVNLPYSYEQKHLQLTYSRIKNEITSTNLCSIELLLKHNIDLLSLFKYSIENIEEPSILEDLYKSLEGVTILDPTCGTGAFIFTALETLLELHIAIHKQKLNVADTSSSTGNPEFEIIKHCIEHNLYGVDIMEESIDILKTRLSLRLLHCYRDNLDAFPEIKTNFKSGNSLIGEVEMIDDNTTLDQLDLLTFQKYHSDEMELIELEEWKKSVLPFHWNFEFYEIVNTGGFDCIIGNPPYIEYAKVKKNYYKVMDLETIDAGNLYAFILEKSYQLLKENGVLGMIVPISIVSTPRMASVRSLFKNNSKYVFYANFGDRPGTLFTGVHQKLTIIISEKSNTNRNAEVYSSNYIHWYKDERENVFTNLYFLQNPFTETENDFYYKIADPIQVSILNKMNGNQKSLDAILKEGGPFPIYVSMRMTFWTKAFLTEKESNEFKTFGFNTETDSKVIMALLNSSIFFMYWECISDCWHHTSKEFKNFKFDIDEMNGDTKNELAILAGRLETELESTKEYIGSVQTEYEYRHKKCKMIIDEIDRLIGHHYRLTHAEMEYLKYYQLKYRMSDEVDSYLEAMGGEN
ncbi:Eco57I restriction-modification methylase domain-containing protein [Bacillus sp. Marseille-P3661]|uniref:Eco57I restriction-modification methylase domain-containing protein n=1 Tax=Bacillus sp. Marseille-P3661 TaxID=1936234 RepID=UPI000C85A044|nr:DNA methyltransferase [Bacillus sp. Marseille-P3661]